MTAGFGSLSRPADTREAEVQAKMKRSAEIPHAGARKARNGGGAHGDRPGPVSLIGLFRPIRMSAGPTAAAQAVLAAVYAGGHAGKRIFPIIRAAMPIRRSAGRAACDALTAPAAGRAAGFLSLTLVTDWLASCIMFASKREPPSGRFPVKFP